jgi:hypothetical protein
MRSLAVLLAICSAQPALGQSKPADDEAERLGQKMCAETKCQRDVHIVLKQKDGSIYDKTFPFFQPIVQELGIAVVPGQTVNIEADILGGRLANLHAVDAVVQPNKTITATLEQMDDGGMMLHVTSPFAQTLKFDMGIMPLDKDELFKTSSCPVIKGSFEMWPYPLLSWAMVGSSALNK